MRFDEGEQMVKIRSVKSFLSYDPGINYEVEGLEVCGSMCRILNNGDISEEFPVINIEFDPRSPDVIVLEEGDLEDGSPDDDSEWNIDGPLRGNDPRLKDILWDDDEN